MNRTIYFDLDGTIANLYGVDNWLNDLKNESTRPYEICEPLFDLTNVISMCNKLITKGMQVGIITAMAKNATPEYCKRIQKAKLEWLATNFNLPFSSVVFVGYGEPKWKYGKMGDFLFDDDTTNVSDWIDNIGSAIFPSKTNIELMLKYFIENY